MRAALAALLLLLAAPAGAAAEPQLQPVGTFASPVHVTAPNGDAARLFVVEKEGRVQLVVNGQRAGTPFLDVTGITDDEGERGLLSIAFPPDYAASGLFYVFLTATNGDLTVLEGRRSAIDPNRADDHRRVVFSIPHPATNHNGGQLAFGPDGLLYVSTGDGGVGGDPQNAQRPGSLLGKILRVDPRSGAAPQVWALGLRNPWRFSFDRLTGDMLIGDVGESAREEIDFAPAGVAGRNYGWPACEGDLPTPCSIPGAIAPVLALARSDGYQSVVGGLVVRDPGLPTLLGRQLFGDHFQLMLRSANVDGGDLRPEPSLEVANASSFGEDGCGHVHVASLSGPVSRIQDGALGPCTARPGTPAPAPPPPGAAPGPADTRAPALRLRAAQRLRRGRLKLTLRADEAATATLRARRFRARSVELGAGATRVVRLKATAKGLRKLRRALRRGRRPLVTVRVGLRDPAGNTRVRRARVRLRR